MRNRVGATLWNPREHRVSREPKNPMKQVISFLMVATFVSTAMAIVAGPLQIYSAVELQFPTALEKHYRIEASSNLENWEPFGDLIVGTGTDFHLLVSTKGTSMRFFRLIDLDISAGLAARYRCDGNALDSSTNRNHGTSLGVTWTTNRFGVPGAAAQFAGTFDSFIRVPHAPSLDITNELTLAAWINFDVGGHEHPRIVHKHVYELFTYEATDAVRRPAFQCLSIGLVVTIAPVLSAGEWRFLAATYDGLTMKLYVDGALVSEVTGPPTPILTNDSDVNIGRNAGTLSDNYKGSIDDVRIYNRALPVAEVLQLFQERD
jgi:concanavalin A-like lectin/glucanase superfamily protein